MAIEYKYVRQGEAVAVQIQRGETPDNLIIITKLAWCNDSGKNLWGFPLFMLNFEGCQQRVRYAIGYFRHADHAGPAATTGT